MSSAWQRFRRLSRLERGMFYRGIFLIPATACAIRFLGLSRVERMMNRRCQRMATPTTHDGAEKWRVADAAVRMTEAASRRGLLHGKCLSKSMVIWYLLRERGFEATLHVGGRKEGSLFEAHAWVELDGRTINDSENMRERFAPFESQVSSALTREK